jgi:hypothetical protein
MFFFYREELLAHHRIPKLHYYPLLTVRDCLLIIFSASLLHPETEDSPFHDDKEPTQRGTEIDCQLK